MGRSQRQQQPSYFMEDRSEPLNPKNASLNDSLQTQYLDLDEEDDSFLASTTRFISNFVGSICTPKQVLGLLRVLKAVTLSFLILTILADLTYIVFVELVSSKEVKEMAGGGRDTILRLYGLALSVLGLAIELDYTRIVKKFSGLKRFIPRALLYFFIAQITGSHPMSMYYSSNSDSSNGDDQQYYGDDDAAQNNGDDDAAAAAYSSATTSEPEIPSSAVGFQRVTSFVLYVFTSSHHCLYSFCLCGL